jgi:hypothetical protein
MYKQRLHIISVVAYGWNIQSQPNNNVGLLLPTTMAAI